MLLIDMFIYTMHVCIHFWCTDVVRIEKIFLVGVSFYMRKLE